MNDRPDRSSQTTSLKSSPGSQRQLSAAARPFTPTSTPSPVAPTSLHGQGSPYAPQPFQKSKSDSNDSRKTFLPSHGPLSPTKIQEPKGYIPVTTKPVRSSDFDLEEKMARMMLQAQVDTEKYERTQREIEFERDEEARYRAQEEAALLRIEEAEKARAAAQRELDVAREAARARRLASVRDWDTRPGDSRPLNEQSRLDPISTITYIHPNARPDEDESQRPRDSRNTFSPGYGYRRAGSDTLPPPEMLIGPHGTHHRVYPAPSPIAAPLNVDQGWEEPDKHQDSHNFEHGSETGLQPYGVIKNDSAVSIPTKGHGSVPTDHGRDRPPHEAQLDVTFNPSPATAKSAYIPWTGGVVYPNPEHNDENPISREELLEGLAAMRKDRQDKTAMRPDNGYGDRSRDISGAGFGDGDNGWNNGERGDDHGGHGNSWGNRERAGGGDACFNCGQAGHLSRDCSEPRKERNGGGGGGGGSTCYNCGESGHMSRECSEPPKPRISGSTSTCYNCGEIGHFSRECEQPVDNSVFRGECNNCGERGYRSRPNLTGMGESQAQQPFEAKQTDALEARNGGWSGNQDQLRVAENGWGRNGDQKGGNDDGWGSGARIDEPAAAEDHPQDSNGWIPPQRERIPETPNRSSPAIHPDRLRMLGQDAPNRNSPREATYQKSPRSTQSFGDGDRKHHRDPSQQSTTNATGYHREPLRQAREPTPPLPPAAAANNEFGGW